MPSPLSGAGMKNPTEVAVELKSIGNFDDGSTSLTVVVCGDTSVCVSVMLTDAAYCVSTSNAPDPTITLSLPDVPVSVGVAVSDPTDI